MAVQHLTITKGQGAITCNPSNYYLEGLSTEGSVTFINNADEYPFALYLSETPDGNLITSIAQYYIPNGQTVALKTAFPDYSLEGKYITSDNITFTSALLVVPTTHCGAPTAPKVSETISRTTVDLNWGAGSAGTNNAVTGYDVQYQDSADGKTWPSSWTTASGSPVTATKMSVSPPATVGYYRRFRVRTRGSAGSDYYSGWVVSTNTLRRKWDAFGAWTDPTLTARSSMIRAVHLTEIQSRVNTIRTFYGITAYSFTTITARSAKIARWASLIQEIRTAIDGITTSHAAWNTLEVGKPRIAHITQLRSIIDSL